MTTNDTLTHVYEVEDKSKEFDFIVFRHDQSRDLLDRIWLSLDDLGDGETLTITHRKYTEEQLAELYES